MIEFLEILGLRKQKSIEKPLKQAVFVASCGQKNPIELYGNEESYPYKCRTCKQQATRKLLFLSPTLEDNWPYGPIYYCKDHVPDIHKVASNKKLYFRILSNKR